ncbi:MAG: tol-pal system YbgF family protein, partial [Bdellovibrionales bacterium]
IAELNLKMKNMDRALSNLNKIINLQKDTGQVDKRLMAKSLEAKADILFKQGNALGAAKVYEDLLSNHEEELGLNNIRYKVGEIYFEKGEIKKAKNFWEPLATKENGNTWHKMARERILDSEWQTEYDRYLNRLPASN